MVTMQVVWIGTGMDLGQIFVTNDLDLSWLKWRKAFLSIMDLCIPHSILPSRQSLPWLTKTLVNTTKKRNHLENQCEVEIYRPSQTYC